MRVILEIDDTAITEAVSSINDDRRQSGHPDRLTVRRVKAALRDPERLADEAAGWLERTIDALA